MQLDNLMELLQLGIDGLSLAVGPAQLVIIMPSQLRKEKISN